MYLAWRATGDTSLLGAYDRSWNFTLAPGIRWPGFGLVYTRTSRSPLGVGGAAYLAEQGAGAPGFDPHYTILQADYAAELYALSRDPQVLRLLNLLMNQLLTRVEKHTLAIQTGGGSRHPERGVSGPFISSALPVLAFANRSRDLVPLVMKQLSFGAGRLPQLRQTQQRSGPGHRGTMRLHCCRCALRRIRRLVAATAEGVGPHDPESRSSPRLRATVRVAFLHNLTEGGARRVMAEQMSRLRGEAREFCLQTATPVDSGATVIRFGPAAEGLPHMLRPAARYWDFQRLLGAWRTVAEAIDGDDADVVVAHPCQVLQCPPAILHLAKQTVYFCHETRRVDYERAAAASRNRLTQPLYAGLYRWQRRTDVRGVHRATRIITNSRYTAAEIRRAYARDALPVALGVSDGFRSAPPGGTPRHF